MTQTSSSSSSSETERQQQPAPSPVRSSLILPLPDRTNSRTSAIELRRGPSTRFRRERERIHSTASSRDLIQLLISEEYEAKTARKLLYTALDRLDASNRHAHSIEARANESTDRCRTLTEALMAAKLEASRAREELAMYKLQLDTAQREIFRAQEILSAVEAQRDEAERSAAKARTTARMINEEHLVRAAREEGRRLGFEEGLMRSRQAGFDDRYGTGYENGRSEMGGVPEHELDIDDASEADRDQDQPTIDDMNLRPESIRIRTPSIASNLLQDAQAAPSGRRSVNSITRPGSSGRPPSTRTQTSTRTRRNSEISIPPDGWIPHADNGSIILPPPHELAAPIPSDVSSIPAQDQTERTQSPASRPYSQSWRRSVPDSLSSSATGISQLEIVSFPNPSRSGRNSAGGIRDRQGENGGPRDLSVIHENSVSPVHSLSRGVGPPMDRSGINASEEGEDWSDSPHTEEWHRGGVETPGRTGSRVATNSQLKQSGHQRTPSGTSDLSRRAMSSGTTRSTSITFDIMPPTPSSYDLNPNPGSSSPYANSQPLQEFLSPNSAHMILPPQSRQQQEQPHFDNVPTVTASPKHFSAPLGAGSATSSSTTRNGNGGSSGSGVPFGVGSHNDNFDLGPPVIPGASKPNSRTQSPSQGRKTPRESYAVAPMPGGVVYPDPASLRMGTPSTGTSRLGNGHGQQPHENANDASSSAVVGASGGGSAKGGKEELRRIPSNTSLSSNKSYARYDPHTYLDPAYYARREGAGARTTAVEGVGGDNGGRGDSPG